MMTAFVGISLLMSSCTKDDDKNDNTPVSQNTITDIVSNNTDFSLLKSAVVKANLATTLSGTGPFTVFAPNDNAFSASGISSTTIESLSVTDLEKILLYHTLGMTVVANDVPNGPNAAVATVGGDSLFVTKNGNGVFVNGWKVNQADIMATNGVIHGIERVLMPPTSNLVQLAQGNNDLSYLVAAVLRASQGSVNVADLLSNGGTFTVFAPTNQAFIDAGFATIADIQNADPAVLTSILTYHVLGGRAFSSDLSNGQMLTTLNGASIEVNIGSSATLTGIGNTAPVNIIGVNVMATNGVVHIIDKVLLP